MDRGLAINALIGSTRELRGFEVAGLINTESLNMSGFQVAGLANAVLGSSAGFQAAGLVNYGGGDMSFFQAAGIVNVVGGRLAGAQFAGLANVAQAGRVLYTGTESHGFVGELPAARGEINLGFQAAGLGNIDFGSFMGAQVAGLTNWTAGSAIGLQVAGILNRSRDLAGLQISLVNLVDGLRGAQLGLYNASRLHYGPQLGLVNVAGELWGTQIGLVNVAECLHGPSLGLISIEKNGIAAIEGTSDVNAHTMAALKLGTRFSYTIMSIGVESPQAPKNWNLALGLGLRLPLGEYFVDADAQWRAYSKERGATPSLIPGSQGAIGRILFGIRLAGAVALVGGLSAELQVPGLSLDPDGSASASFAWKPGFVFGAQL
jgi:hypothetical protein